MHSLVLYELIAMLVIIYDRWMESIHVLKVSIKQLTNQG